MPSIPLWNPNLNARVSDRERVAVMHGPDDPASTQEIADRVRQRRLLELSWTPPQPTGEPLLLLGSCPVAADEEFDINAVGIHRQLTDSEIVAIFGSHRAPTPATSVEQMDAPAHAQMQVPGTVVLRTAPLADAVHSLAALPHSLLLELLPLLTPLELDRLWQTSAGMHRAMQRLPPAKASDMENARRSYRDLLPCANNIATVTHLETKAEELAKTPVSAGVLGWALTVIPRAMEQRQLREAIRIERNRYPQLESSFHGRARLAIERLMQHHGYLPAHYKELQECMAYQTLVRATGRIQDALPEALPHSAVLALMNRLGMDTTSMQAAIVKDSNFHVGCQLDLVMMEILNRAIREFSKRHGTPEEETKRS